jgi:hypothetical protein
MYNLSCFVPRALILLMVERIEEIFSVVRMVLLKKELAFKFTALSCHVVVGLFGTGNHSASPEKTLLVGSAGANLRPATLQLSSPRGNDGIPPRNIGSSVA